MTIYEETYDIRELPNVPKTQELNLEAIAQRLDKIFNQILVHGEAEGIAYHFEGNVDELCLKYKEAKGLYRILKKIDLSYITTERDEKMGILYDAQDLAKRLFREKQKQKAFPTIEKLLNNIYEQ